jgi:hypothetical protein
MEGIVAHGICSEGFDLIFPTGLPSGKEIAGAYILQVAGRLAQTSPDVVHWTSAPSP